jgi:Uma2 family endonuclease
LALAYFQPLTIEQYDGMRRAGILQEGAPIELIDGMLVRKNRAAAGANPMTIGELHTIVIGKIVRLDPRLARYGAHVRIQAPVALPPDQAPEPDGAIVRGSLESYADHHPLPREICCVIEAADSSLQYDRTDKQRIYADASIPQYIIVNIPERQVEVHEQPLAGQGRYAQVKIAKAGEQVSLLVGAEQRLEIAAAELLP